VDFHFISPVEKEAVQSDPHPAHYDEQHERQKESAGGDWLFFIGAFLTGVCHGQPWFEVELASSLASARPARRSTMSNRMSAGTPRAAFRAVR
jgi:hypothetical protein